MNPDTIDFRTIYREFKIFVVWAKRMQESFDGKFASLSENLDAINDKCDKLMSERRRTAPLAERRTWFPMVVLKKLDENVTQSQPRKKRGPKRKLKEASDTSLTMEEVVEQREAPKVKPLKYEELVPVIPKIVEPEVLEKNKCTISEKPASILVKLLESDVTETCENELTKHKEYGEKGEKTDVSEENVSVNERDVPESVMLPDVNVDSVCVNESTNGKESVSKIEIFEKADVIEEIASKNESVAYDEPEPAIQEDVSEESGCENESTNGKESVSKIEIFEKADVIEENASETESVAYDEPEPAIQEDVSEESGCENDFAACIDDVSEPDVMEKSSSSRRKQSFKSTKCKEPAQVIDIANLEVIEEDACEIVNEVHQRQWENITTTLINSPKKRKQSSLENYFVKCGPKINNCSSSAEVESSTDDVEIMSETTFLEPKEVQSQRSRKRGRKFKKGNFKSRKRSCKDRPPGSETDSAPEIIPLSSDHTREQLENLYKMNYKYSQDMIGILEADVHLLSLEFQKYLKCKCESEDDVSEFFEETKRLISEMQRIHKAWKHIKPQADDLLNKNEDLCRALLNVYVEAMTKLNNGEEKSLMSSLKGWPNVSLITFRIDVDSFEQEVEDFLKRNLLEYNWKEDELRTSLWEKYFILETKALEIQADTEEILTRLKSTVHKISLIDILFEQPVMKPLEHFGKMELIKKDCKNTGLALYYTVRHSSTAESLDEHLQILQHLCIEYLTRQYDNEHFFEAQTLCTRSILIGDTAERVQHDAKRFKKVSGEHFENVLKYYEATAPKDEVKRNLEIAKTKYGLNAKYYNLFLGSKRLKLPPHIQIYRPELKSVQPEEVQVSSIMPEELQNNSDPSSFESYRVLDSITLLEVLSPQSQVGYRKIAPAPPNVSPPGKSAVQPEVASPGKRAIRPKVAPPVSWVLMKPNSHPLIQPDSHPSIQPKGKSLIPIVPKGSVPVTVRSVPVVSNILVPFSQPSTSHTATIITKVQPSTYTLNPSKDPTRSNS